LKQLHSDLKGDKIIQLVSEFVNVRQLQIRCWWLSVTWTFICCFIFLSYKQPHISLLPEISLPCLILATGLILILAVHLPKMRYKHLTPETVARLRVIAKVPRFKELRFFCNAATYHPRVEWDTAYKQMRLMHIEESWLKLHVMAGLIPDFTLQLFDYGNEVVAGYPG